MKKIHIDAMCWTAWTKHSLASELKPFYGAWMITQISSCSKQFPVDVEVLGSRPNSGPLQSTAEQYLAFSVYSRPLPATPKTVLFRCYNLTILWRRVSVAIWQKWQLGRWSERRILKSDLDRLVGGELFLQRYLNQNKLSLTCLTVLVVLDWGPDTVIL